MQPDATKPELLARACGDCSLCCKVFDTEISPGLGWCSLCRPGNGCAIYYGNRPNVSKNFECFWLIGYCDFLGEEWKPSVCKIVATYDPERAYGLALYVDPDFPDIWRSEPYYSHIKKLSHEEDTGQVIVHVGNRVWLVKPHVDIEIPAGKHFAVAKVFARWETFIFETEEEYLQQIRLSTEPM